MNKIYKTVFRVELQDFFLFSATVQCSKYCSKYLLDNFCLPVRVSHPDQDVENQLLSDFALSWVVFHQFLWHVDI